MQVSKTALSPTEFKLKVVADQKYLAVAKEHVLKHMATKHVKLPGFRDGKAPLNLVEKQADPNQLQQEFLDEAINSLYAQLIRAEKLRPVANPKITVTKFVPFTDLEFEAEVEAVGDIKLANYKSIKIAKPAVEVTAKDVNEVVDSLRQRQAERQAVQRPSKDGDELVIDFKGTDTKGQLIKGADGKDYPIIIGSNTFIPGFEPHLVGLKTGQEKSFNITFPQDYAVKALQAKKVKFEVKVKQVSELVQPKLDNKFAAQAGPFKTITELKADIKKQIKAERETGAEREFENSLVMEIANKSELAIPEVLVNEQIDRQEQSEKQNIAYKGQTWAEHLAEEGVTEEEHRQRNRPDAEANIKAGLVLSEIAEAEGLTVTPEELEIRIQLLRGQYKDEAMQTELDKPENRQDIANRLLTEKTVNKLKEYVQK